MSDPEIDRLRQRCDLLALALDYLLACAEAYLPPLTDSTAKALQLRGAIAAAHEVLE